MIAARILTPIQVMMLREAAQVLPVVARSKAIDEATAFIKKQSPEKFFHYTKDNKPDPAMKQRVFHDEPRNLELFEYASYQQPYVGIGQSEIYKARNKILLTNHKKIKGEK